MNPNFIFLFYRRRHTQKEEEGEVEWYKNFSKVWITFRNANSKQSKFGALLYDLHSLNLFKITSDYGDNIYCLKILFLLNVYI